MLVLFFSFVSFR